MLFLPPISSFFHHSAIVSVCARCLSLTKKCTLLFISSPTNSDKFMHHGLVLPSLVLLKEWTARCYEVCLKGTDPLSYSVQVVEKQGSFLYDPGFRLSFKT